MCSRRVTFALWVVQGQDDLRQDAVMQQVFHMCSTLLQRNAETRKRKLNIRRYKVTHTHRHTHTHTHTPDSRLKGNDSLRGDIRSHLSLLLYERQEGFDSTFLSFHLRFSSPHSPSQIGRAHV